MYRDGRRFLTLTERGSYVPLVTKADVSAEVREAGAEESGHAGGDRASAVDAMRAAAVAASEHVNAIPASTALEGTSGDRPPDPPVPHSAEGVEHTHLPRSHEEILAELRKAEWTAGERWKLHARRRQRNALSEDVLKIGTTLLAALAAVSVLGDALGPWFTGITAALAALLSGLQQTFNPAARARFHAEFIAQWELQLLAFEELRLFEQARLMSEAEFARKEYCRLKSRNTHLTRAALLAQPGGSATTAGQ